jgi:preprotein translocase subunit SecD
MEKRREALRQSVGGGVLAKWNEELATISMRLTENAANGQYVAKKLHEIESRSLLQLAARFENEVEARITAVRQDVYAMQQNISALRERIQQLQQPPVVSMLAGQKEKP